MAIHKRAPHPTLPGQHVHLVMPAFSFAPNDALAQMIVDAWTNPGKLLDRDPKTHLPTKAAVDDATKRVKKAGFDLARAVVITEAEHDRDYIMQSDDEIVFVLPDKKRLATPPSNLLDTAKLLMACTPNLARFATLSRLRRCVTRLERGWAHHPRSDAGEYSEVGGFEWHGC